MNLEGKVCVITGATSGIGEVGAQELARLGAEPGTAVQIGDIIFDFVPSGTEETYLPTRRGSEPRAGIS